MTLTLWCWIWRISGGDDVDVQHIIDNLPREPDCGVRAFVHKNWDELGGHRAIFKRTRARAIQTLTSEIDPGETFRMPWAAECWCTECGEVWETAWAGNKGVYVCEGDDGAVYPIDPQTETVYGLTRYDSGQAILCPVCGEGVTLTHVSKFPAREFRQRQFIVCRQIGKYTALVSWLAGREISPGRSQTHWIRPWVANVIDEQGRIRGFRWGEHGWRKASTLRPETTKYPSGDGWAGFVSGGFIERPIDELAGQTGEKTGLAAYLEVGGCFPTQYLRLWKRFPALENLMKSHMGQCAARAVDSSWNPSTLHICEAFDLSRRKPHEMAGMTRAQFRAIAESPWPYEKYCLWFKARDSGLCADPVAFAGYWSEYSVPGIRTALRMAGSLPGLTLERIDRYLVDKQGLRPSDIGLVEDLWRAHHQLYLRPPATDEERWPTRLIEAHDRIAAELAANERGSYKAGFDLVSQRLAPVAWADGELCIVIPRSQADLTREGEVLRHCVGGYAKLHTTGRPVFFVRHYRRPERPYYTLNIDLTGRQPRRIQLHGYGNERHGDRKQYTHKIPQKVLDFCDRWEREILAPFWEEYQKHEEVPA